MSHKNIAIIVGNGTSRRELDLASMVKTLGDDRPMIYGCNALYREFESSGYIVPDYLVAIDDGIIAEIESSSFPAGKLIVPPEDERWEPWELHPTGHRPRGNAGMAAMLAAIRNGAKTLLCCGFDSFLQDGTQSVSNMYDGTPNYGPETRANVSDNFGRIRYMTWVARTNPSVDFIFVYPDDHHAMPIGERNVYETSYNKLVGSAE